MRAASQSQKWPREVKPWPRRWRVDGTCLRTPHPQTGDGPPVGLGTLISEGLHLVLGHQHPEEVRALLTKALPISLCSASLCGGRKVDEEVPF